MTECDAYAIGYYYGRAIGDDEQGRSEIPDHLVHMYKDGYERGVTDYSEEVDDNV